MIDLMTLLAGSSSASLDPAALGVDAALVGAVHEGTNRVKEWLQEHQLEGRLGRFYVLIPIIVGFVLCWMKDGGPMTLAGAVVAGKGGFTYALLSTYGWNIYKKMFKGE